MLLRLTMVKLGNCCVFRKKKAPGKEMPEYLKCEQDKDRSELFSFVPFAVCVALVFILAYILGLAPIKKYEFADSDCYLRLLRVEKLHNGGNWRDPVILRINPPYGQTSHWTRPFDVLLLTGALPIAMFTDFESALFWWGVIISPVLLIATLIALQWSSRPVLSSSKDGPFLACFVFVLQITTLSYYQSGRPDHHGLIVLLFVLSIGFTLRMLLRPVSARFCYIAGAIGALSMWVSVESMVSVAVTIGVLGLFWLLEDGDFLDKSLHYTLALFVVTGLGLVIERSWHSLLVDEYDSLSIVHFTIFGFVAILWIAIYMLNRRTRVFSRRATRLSGILLCGAVLATAILLSFPKFYKGPLVDMDPRLISVWFSRIAEIQPLISRSGSLLLPVQLIGSSVLCFPFLSYLLLKGIHHKDRKGWFYILFLSAIFMAISLYQIRWSVYIQVLLSIPMARIMVLMRQRGPTTGFLKTLKNVFVVLVFSSAFLLLGLLADAIFKTGDSAKKGQGVSLVRMCDYLSRAEEWRGKESLILTHVDFGAEILYRTQHEVLGTPHASGTPSRNGQGILDTYDIMTADTDEQALEIIKKRGIDLILLCPKPTESAFYSKPGHESTFYKRLCEGVIPDWLRKVKLPSDLSSSFLLFETLE
jgi:hypothetical protein